MKASRFLPPFVPDEECPKCGNDQVATTHEPSTAHDGCELGRRLGTARGGEHLVRSCTRCGFRWEQACIETAEAATG